MGELKKYFGKSCEVTIVQDSISSTGKRITTFQLRYPRLIHAELMTHRLFSRNASSTRAVPITSISSVVEDDPVYPMVWGKNKSGMQSSEELSGIEAIKCASIWKGILERTIVAARALSDIGLHKQWAGRILEPYQMMNTILTATEYENWFWLRDHNEAQPEIQELAHIMHTAMEESTPVKILSGEWHLPFITRENIIVNDEDIVTYSADGLPLNLEEAKMISASACAQVSYRKNDVSLEKAKDIWTRLFDTDHVHASPLEHQATPIVEECDWLDTPGITHVDTQGRLWSGNFCGWIQHRQLIPNNAKW